MRVGNTVIRLKAPWKPAMFSERDGSVKRLPLGFGWRVTFRRVLPFNQIVK